MDDLPDNLRKTAKENTIFASFRMTFRLFLPAAGKGVLCFNYFNSFPA